MYAYMHVIREARPSKRKTGLWNVGMAAPRPPALVVLSYDPIAPTPDAQIVCWVGKGIIYDTGGLSIKVT